MNNSSTEVIVGMSGGVDSSVAAHLLIEQGYSIAGLFMKNWDEDDGTDYCTAEADLTDVKQIASKLGIKLHKANFSAEYWDHVFSNFISEIKLGRTPNPDILCNKEIKFRAFLDHSLALGARLIATGHYASMTNEDNPLKRAKDLAKDQTYFLWALSQDQLKYCLFPLNSLLKNEVREIAKRLEFGNADKKDSTGICFIGERHFNNFLMDFIEPNPGIIETETGEKIGEHDGLSFHTIGQRRGLGIGGKAKYANKPWFVAKKNLARNSITVVQGNEHPLLLSKKLIARQINWIGKTPKLPLNISAKIRYRSLDAPCKISNYGQGVLVEFKRPERAVTPGQSIVFYEKNTCLGGGIIEESFCE